MEKIKCPLCGEEIKEDDETFAYPTINGDYVCINCGESETEYPSTIFKFNQGKIEQCQFTKHFGIAETANGDFSGQEGKLPEPIKSQEWIKSDGWRGYTDWKLNEGYIKVADGWITGHPDEYTRRKLELGEYFDDLVKGKITPPVPIYWVFGITSNIFSQTSCIVIKKTNKEAVAEWLEKINGGLEEFAEKFN